MSPPNIINDVEKKGNDKLKDIALDKILKWIEEPQQKWCSQPEKEHKQHDYRTYLATKLRGRYTEIDTDFGTIFPNYVYGKYENKRDSVLASAEQIVSLLESAKATLIKEKYGKQELLLATKLLDLAEENMVWIYPEDLLNTEIPDVRSCLDAAQNLDSRADYRDQLEKLKDPPKSQPEDENRADENRAILANIISICNVKNLEEMINTDLQIERLRHFRKWGAILVLVLLIAFPMIANPGIFKEWSNNGNSTIYNTINATGKEAIELDY